MYHLTPDSELTSDTSPRKLSCLIIESCIRYALLRAHTTVTVHYRRPDITRRSRRLLFREQLPQGLTVFYARLVKSRLMNTNAYKHELIRNHVKREKNIDDQVGRRSVVRVGKSYIECAIHDDYGARLFSLYPVDWLVLLADN